MSTDEQFICSKMFTDLNIKFATNTVKNCCKTEDYHLPTSSIELHQDDVFFNDVEFKERKLNMVRDNKLPPACGSCIKTHPNSLFKVWNTWPQKMSPTEKKNLLTADNFCLYEIVLSNSCDLACVYCSEKDSTSWAKEKNIPIVSGDPAWKEKILERFFKHLESKKFFSDKDYWFFFSGGEPTYNPETLLVIEKIIALVPSTQLKIVITTNINSPTVIFNRYLNLVDQNKNISWRFDCSIDGLHKHAEAIRYGLNWDRAISNITQLLKRSNVQTCINPTLNVLSIPQLPDFIIYFIELFSSFNKEPKFGANMVIEDNLSILQLPPKFKGKIDEAIKICNDAGFINPEFMRHLTHATNLIGTGQNENARNALHDILSYFKLKRPEIDYMNLFPHLTEILNPPDTSI